MVCGEYPAQPINYWLEFRFMDGAVCTYGDQIGVGVTMLMFFGITFLVLYQASDSVMVPVGALIVLAPVTMALLPAIGIQFVAVVVIVAVAMLGVYAYISAG